MSKNYLDWDVERYFKKIQNHYTRINRLSVNIGEPLFKLVSPRQVVDSFSTNNLIYLVDPLVKTKMKLDKRKEYLVLLSEVERAYINLAFDEQRDFEMPRILDEKLMIRPKVGSNITFFDAIKEEILFEYKFDYNYNLDKDHYMASLFNLYFMNDNSPIYVLQKSSSNSTSNPTTGTISPKLERTFG